MKAICLWYMLAQLGKGYSTNATLHLTIRHLNHHDENLKSCKGNSLSSGQVLLLSEINGWRFALIPLRGLQPQQQNSALQFRLTNEEHAVTILLPNLVENHYLRLAILILWSLSGVVNKGFLTYIPPSFSGVLCTQSLRELSKQRLLLWTQVMFSKLTFFFRHFHIQESKSPPTSQTPERSMQIKLTILNEHSAQEQHNSPIPWLSNHVSHKARKSQTKVAFKATHTFALQESIATPALARERKKTHHKNPESL